MKLFKALELKTINGQPEKTSNLLGSSNQWFLNSDLNFIDFDFFIDWRSQSFVPNVFVKKIFKDKESEEIFRKKFQEDPQKLLTELSQDLEKYKVLEKYNINIRFLFFNDHEKEPTIYSFNNGESEILSIQNLKDLILEYTGKKFRIGNKGLTWATSELERSLSLTDTPYTGDCDLLTFDNNGNILSIFEYQKKFDGNYLFFNQLYNGNQKTKFKRLMILRDYLKSQREQNIFLNVIHYSNNSNPIVETILNKEQTVQKSFSKRHFEHTNFLTYLSSNLHLIQNMVFLSSIPSKNPDILYTDNQPINITNNSVLIIDDMLKSETSLLNQLKNTPFLFLSDLKNNSIILIESISDELLHNTENSQIVILTNNKKDDEIIKKYRKQGHHIMLFNNTKTLKKVKLLSNQKTNKPSSKNKFKT